MQEEIIKEIISLYVKIPAEQVGYNTKIDRSAIASSIMLHRLYADLAKAGFEVAGYWDITDYGTLLKRLGSKDMIGGNGVANIRPPAFTTGKANPDADINQIGIDVEETVNMPAVSDFREDKFYTKYFSPSEIAYCILQPRPLLSFAGLFAVKEAIIKADNTYKNFPFDTIVIDHIPGGKPTHPDFYLSITHSENLAIAVAIQKNILATSPSITGIKSSMPAINTTLLYALSFSAIILALITFIVIILRQ